MGGGGSAGRADSHKFVAVNSSLGGQLRLGRENGIASRGGGGGGLTTRLVCGPGGSPMMYRQHFAAAKPVVGSADTLTHDSQGQRRDYPDTPLKVPLTRHKRAGEVGQISCAIAGEIWGSLICGGNRQPEHHSDPIHHIAAIAS